MPLKLYERPNGIFHIRGTVQGRRVDESARTRLRAEAEAIRAKLEADLFKRAVYGDRAVATFAEAADAYMVGGGSTDHMTTLLHRIGNTPLRQIDQEFIDRLARDMKPDAKPSTLIRQVYTPIIAVLNHAAKRKLCDTPQIDKPEVSNGRVDYLTPTEAEALLKLLPAHMKALVTFYLATGCRASEALALEWRDISPEAERVVFWDTKTNLPRGVNLQKRARKVLPERRKSPDPLWLNSEGQPWHGYDAINLMLRRHTEKAGFRHVHCHLFRHTWATWAYACTRDLTFLMQQGGWRTPAMVLRYAHAASDDLGRSVLGHGWEFDGREVVKPLPKNPKPK
jgi:integrase